MTNRFPIKYKPTIFESKVENFEGECVPIWLDMGVQIGDFAEGTVGVFKKFFRLTDNIVITYGAPFRGVVINKYVTGIML